MMLSKAQNSDKDSIIKALKSVKKYNGVVGTWNLIESSTDRYLSSPFHVKVIRGGSIETLY